MDCRQSVQVCFDCNREGHIRTHYPLLIFCEVHNPTPLAWQIPDGCPGKVEVNGVEGGAYQLVTEDSRPETTSTTGMFPVYFIFAFMNWVLLLEVSFWMDVALCMHVCGKCYVVVGGLQCWGDIDSKHSN